MPESRVLRSDKVASGAKRNGWLHFFAVVTAVTTFCLIFVGGLVTSHDAGLSVPDWPSTYGQFMLSFPYSKWVGNIFYEHSHRVMATAVGFMITVQAIWLQFSEERNWVKLMGWLALVGVIAQGVLGGLTVIFFLPPAISSAHASLAQMVFCLALSIALVTSRKWVDDLPKSQESHGSHIRVLGVISVGAIFLQLMIGAVMRHTSSGLAIPTFPLAFGKVIPDFTSFGIAINFAHRVGALTVATLVIITVTDVFRHYRTKSLRRPAAFAIVLLITQISLGAIAILTSKAVTPTTLHVSGGAALLGTMLVLTIRTRHLFSPASKAVEATSSARSVVSDPALGKI